MDLKLKLKLRPSFFFSFLIFIFLLQKPELGSASNPKCISFERKALLTFKQSLTDPFGRLSSWSGPDCCKWRGVGCDRRTSHVIKIDLRNPNQTLRPQDYYGEFKKAGLGGKINPSLTRLKFLSYLDLSSNDFNFTEIPEFLGNIVSLRYLNLSFTALSGEVPTSFGNLSKLETLDLYAQGYGEYGTPQNTLSASNLGWLSGLSSLTYLDLGLVSMFEVPENGLTNFSSLSKLKELHLYGCGLINLSLHFPSWKNLKLLEVFDFSGNYFHTSIPNWLFDLTSLKKLSLRWCFLTGSIPPEFNKFQLLETLDLSGNELSGTIPTFLGDLPQLKFIDLYANSFRGQIHKFIDSLSKNKDSSLVYLSLSLNKLVGTLPESLGALTNLQTLDLSGNYFTGSIPSSIGNMTSLKKLVLSFNPMNGTIASSLGKLEELVDLCLTENKWEGVLLKSHFVNLRSLKSFRLTTDPNISLVINLPSTWVPPFRLELIEIQNCHIGPSFPMWLQVQDNLNSVTLRNNGIADKIPHSWFAGIASHVTYLILEDNRIKGRLPQNLVFPNLRTVDLSTNNFEGPFPLWTTNAAQIHLHQNNFSGSLPLNLGELMPRMERLDLSNNSFTGEIPSSLCQVTGLLILNLRSNRFSGSFPKCWHLSPELFEIDLSDNNISGEIPAEILDIAYLRNLNLSRNSMAGSIPRNISKLDRLEMLDLSRNNFSGTIPHSLSAMYSLQTLNLSYNKLEGRIPEQLTFEDPSIYIGNELLCGKPLPKKCPRKQQTAVVN